LMDEPFAALDAMTRHLLQEELTRIQRESRKSIVLITHNIDEALIMADRIVVMSPHPGQVKAVITNDLERPRNMDVQLSRAWGELKKEIWSLVAGDVSLHVS
jgi:NitT/TauT family transport system ATP-binding protein